MITVGPLDVIIPTVCLLESNHRHPQHVEPSDRQGDRVDARDPAGGTRIQLDGANDEARCLP